MDNKKLLQYALGAGIAYFLILKPILEKLGLTKTAEQVQAQKNIETYVEKTIKTISPTKSVGEWQIIADQIYRDLKFSAIDDDKDDAVVQLCRAKNEGDVALLIKLFGLRQETWFGIIPDGSPKDLQQFVKSNLSNKQIGIVNENYRRKNIKYRF